MYSGFLTEKLKNAYNDKPLAAENATKNYSDY